MPCKSVKEKYENYDVKKLKKALKTLKSTNSDVAEIKYVSCLLRNKLDTNRNKSTLTTDESFNHDKYIERNFWEYVKNIFSRKHSVLPTFNMTECSSYSKNVFAKINPNKLSEIPSWIPVLPNPIVEFDPNPPSYQQITNIIRKTKASGSPCPFDQLSIICFK